MNDNNPYLSRFLLAVFVTVAVLIAKDHVPAGYAHDLAGIGLVAILVAVICGIRALLLAGMARSRQGGDQ